MWRDFVHNKAKLGTRAVEDVGLLSSNIAKSTISIVNREISDIVSKIYSNSNNTKLDKRIVGKISREDLLFENRQLKQQQEEDAIHITDLNKRIISLEQLEKTYQEELKQREDIFNELVNSLNDINNEDDSIKDTMSQLSQELQKIQTQLTNDVNEVKHFALCMKSTLHQINVTTISTIELLAPLVREKSPRFFDISSSSNKQANDRSTQGEQNKV